MMSALGVLVRQLILLLFKDTLIYYRFFDVVGIACIFENNIVDEKYLEQFRTPRYTIIGRVMTISAVHNCVCV